MPGWGRLVMRALAAVLVVVLGACTGAAPSHDVAPLSWSAADTDAAAGPCALLSQAEVEQALSATIMSSRVRHDGGLTHAATFTLPGEVCEYHGMQAEPSEGLGVMLRDRAVSDLLGTAGIPDAVLARARRGLERPEREQAVGNLQTLELSVSVTPRAVSRSEFDARYARRVAAFARRAAVATEPGALTVDPHFVEHATDGAKDIGGIGDAARWYPAMAQLEVLVGDRAFAVSRLREAPLIGAPLLGQPVEPLYDPPQELVDIARLASERL